MAGASRRSLAERLEAWSGVCDAAAAGELADADASAALVSVVFASLREHDDKPSRVALARAVDAALTHSPAFLKAFAARLLKAASDTPQAMEPTRRRELLRWSCALVRHLDLATHAGAFAKVAKAQGDLLCAEAVAASRTSPAAVTNESETARHLNEPTARANKSFQRLLGAFSGRRRASWRRTETSSLRSPPTGRPTPPRLWSRRRRRRRAAWPGRSWRGRTRWAPRARARGGGTKRPSKVQRGGGEAEAASAPPRGWPLWRRARARSAADALARGVFHGDARNPLRLPVELGRALDAFVATMTEDEMRDEAAPRIERQLRRRRRRRCARRRRALERAPARGGARARRGGGRRARRAARARGRLAP